MKWFRLYPKPPEGHEVRLHHRLGFVAVPHDGMTPPLYFDADGAWKELYLDASEWKDLTVRSLQGGEAHEDDSTSDPKP